jgi:hypothetical protein
MISTLDFQPLLSIKWIPESDILAADKNSEVGNILTASVKA